MRYPWQSFPLPSWFDVTIRQSLMRPGFIAPPPEYLIQALGNSCETRMFALRLKKGFFSVLTLVELTPEQEKSLERSVRLNLVFFLIFALFLFGVGFYSLSPTNISTPPGVPPEVFAALLVAEVIGFTELAKLMRDNVDESDFYEVQKHFNWFLRLMTISIGSGLVGLVASTFSPASWFGFFVMILSAGSLYFLLVRSLDYIFSDKEEAVSPRKPRSESQVLELHLETIS